MTRPITVWTEIPVTDLDRSARFYSTVFGYQMTIDTSTPSPMAVFDGQMQTAGGHLYQGTPAPEGGATVHLALPDTIEAGAERCRDAGGQILGDPISLPDGSRFIYARDLDGNSIGLFQAA